MKKFVAVSLFMISGAAFAGNATFLPQCSIQSQHPYYQPDLSKPFYLARNKDNQTIQYCNEDGLLKDLPWVDQKGNMQDSEHADLLKFRIRVVGLPHRFSQCSVSGGSKNKAWDIDHCKHINIVKGLAILANNP